MNVSCPDCRSIFRVDPAKVPPSGVRARCSVCSGVITIPAPSGIATPTGAASRPITSGAEAPPPERPRPTQGGQAWEGQSTAPAPRPVAPVPPTQRPAAPPPPPPRTEVPAAPRPRPESGERPAATATATPPSPATARPPFSQPTPAQVPPVARPTPAAGPAGPGAGPSGPPFVPPSPPPRAAAPPSPPATPARPAAPASTPPTGADSGARRPLNPFLSKDPDQRAKRLARALVSDIITYHPAKHAEGLRDGTLKQLFREEIKKSFEEYIAQVGQQLAESTTYFQEALNEVLGGGKKIF